MGKHAIPLRAAGAGPRGSTSARVLLSVFSGLPALLESFGVHSASILQQHGLTRVDLNEPDRSGSYHDIGRLLHHCVGVTGCRHFGLLLSRSVDLRSLGLPGRLAQYSNTVQAALESIASSFELHDSGAEIDLVDGPGEATFSYTIHASGVVAVEQVYDFALGVMTNVLRELCGDDWHPTLVMLPRRLPASLEPYHSTLGSELQFSATKAVVAFQSRWLAQPVRGADPYIYRLLQHEVSSLLDQTNPLICRDLRRVIIGRLHDGHCSRREVAQVLGLHERTLCRQLKSAGTTFQHLLDEVRSELAQQLLGNTQAPITEIAQQLGFGSSTVMARSFRRWTGMSPRQYRSGHRQVH